MAHVEVELRRIVAHLVEVDNVGLNAAHHALLWAMHPTIYAAPCDVAVSIAAG